MNEMRKLMETVKPLFEDNTVEKPLVEYFAREGESIDQLLNLNVFTDLGDGGQQMVDNMGMNNSGLAKRLKNTFQTEVETLGAEIQRQAQRGRVLTAQEADAIEGLMVDYSGYDRDSTKQYLDDVQNIYPKQIELAKQILSNGQ